MKPTTVNDSQMPGEPPSERRRAPRLVNALPITLCATDVTQDPLVYCTWLENLSAGGLYVCIPRPLMIGSPLLARVQVGCVPFGTTQRVAIIGMVRRVEAPLDSLYGTAVQITWRHALRH
jgi:hypothetical protein